jgi:hypothetical protein
MKTVRGGVRALPPTYRLRRQRDAIAAAQIRWKSRICAPAAPPLWPGIVMWLRVLVRRRAVLPCRWAIASGAYGPARCVP